MSALNRILRQHLASDATVSRIGQLACFAAAPALLVVALSGLTRFASTPGEVFLGVLASSAVALLLVLMGLVLPLATGKPTA